MEKKYGRDPWHLQECHFNPQGISLQGLLLKIIIKAWNCDPGLRLALYIFALP